jgi:pimeloyl-ACP methyl ester carboxylesterase
VIEQPDSRPAGSHAEALERVAAFRALDDESIRPEAYTRLYDCGSRTPIAVVLLHGFTNHPGQYETFAPMVRDRGHNVFVPRLPEHGDKDRMTTRLASLTAEELLGATSEALDIARGLGERVCMLGISTSALLCAYFAQYRADVARSILVAPVFAILRFPYLLSTVTVRAFGAAPNAFLWWDPRKKAQQLPKTAYPRFPTHGLAQAMRVGFDVHAESGSHPPQAGCAELISNRADPAVNNRVSENVVERWNARRPGFATSFTFTDLPANHDIIDTNSPRPRPEIVYPRLLTSIERTS